MYLLLNRTFFDKKHKNTRTEETHNIFGQKTQVRKDWIMDEPCDTALIHLSHLYNYTKSCFGGLSLFMSPRVHILSLDICGGGHDGPERWCLTAADTESTLCGHWRRRHPRAWSSAAHTFYMWAPLWGPAEWLLWANKIQCLRETKTTRQLLCSTK